MKQILKKYQTLLLGTVAGLTVTLTMVWSFGMTNQPQLPTDIPSPFDFEMQTSLQGAVTRIGTRNNFPVDNITYDLGEVSEPLSVDTIQFVLTPASGISSGAPLKAAITSGKRVFGYKYTPGAQTEIAMRDVVGATFAQRFPGQFFTSDEQRADGSHISGFESTNGVIFLPLSHVALTANARYVIITNDTATSFQVKNLMWCGNGFTEVGETCDDGDTESGDGCSNICATEAGYVCSGQPSSCTDGGSTTGGGTSGNTAGTTDGDTSGATSGTTAGGTAGTTGGGGDPVCGNGLIENMEQCDDGDTDSGDGCSSMCSIEVGYSCLGAPSICSVIPICGNGITEAGEECDDGNLIDNDSCSNDCTILVTPLP